MSNLFHSTVAARALARGSKPVSVALSDGDPMTGAFLAPGVIRLTVRGGPSIMLADPPEALLALIRDAHEARAEAAAADLTAMRGVDSLTTAKVPK